MKKGQQVDWKKTRIAASRYAHDHDVWARLELGDDPPRFDLDDAWDGVFETPARRDAVAGRNRKQFGKMRGSLSFALDSLDAQPPPVIANMVELKLRGRALDNHQRGLIAGLKFYLSDKSSMREINPATVRGLLTALAA